MLPCKPFAIFQQMLRPSPQLCLLSYLLALSVVLKQGLNRFFRSSSFKPIPSSVTIILTCTFSLSTSSTLTLVIITPRSNENLIAFERRLRRIYFTLIQSIINQISFCPYSNYSSSFLREACPLRISIASLITSSSLSWVSYGAKRLFSIRLLSNSIWTCECSNQDVSKIKLAFCFWWPAVSVLNNSCANEITHLMGVNNS